jgi:hypothetical protein
MDDRFHNRPPSAQPRSIAAVHTTPVISRFQTEGRLPDRSA